MNGMRVKSTWKPTKKWHEKLLEVRSLIKQKQAEKKTGLDDDVSRAIKEMIFFYEEEEEGEQHESQIRLL